MSQIVERSSLDLRYEGHRLRDGAREARLLASIAERGIEQPLEGVDTPAGRFLLDGFKRARCAQKLGLDSVPYVSLGEDEALGILSLMRAATDKALSLREQARFIGELLTVHGLSLPEIAEKLSRSKGWVSMRKQLLEAMSPAIQELLFRGAFPV
jgi:ParB-like chromosome segregation protein Spo0J